MEKDIFSCLQEKYASLSKGQKGIAKYIQENREQAAFLTAAKIARAVGVSESTVVRFALELGYSGYPEMQEALRTQVLKKLSPEEEGEEYDGIAAAISRDVIGLNKVRDTLNRDLLVAAAEVTARAGRVYLHGSGKAAFLTEPLKNALLRLRSGVYHLNSRDPETLSLELLDGEDGDVFVELIAPNHHESKACDLAQKMGYVTVVFGADKGDYGFPCDGEEGELIPAGLLSIVHGFLGALRDIRWEAADDRKKWAESILKQGEEKVHGL